MTNADAVELAKVPESGVLLTVMSGPVSELMFSVRTVPRQGVQTKQGH